MAEILLANPRRRRKSARRRNPRRRRMSALQRKYFGRRRRKNPTPRYRRKYYGRVRSTRRRRIHRNPVGVYLNPRRRRRRYHNPRLRRRRRNPSMRGIGGRFTTVLRDGFLGATGAIGLDTLWGYSQPYLPAALATSDLGKYAAKLLGAVLIGMTANHRMMRRLPLIGGRGRELATGASTVVMHEALRNQIQSTFPNWQLGEYLTYAPAVGVMPRAGRLLSTGVAGMGEYLSGIPDQNDDSSYTGDWNGDGMNGC